MKLNIGEAPSHIDGFVLWDIREGKSAYPLPFESGEAEEISVSNILERFSHKNVVQIFREWVRVLKPGGRIRVSVPDFQKILAVREQLGDSFERAMFGSHTSESEQNRSWWDENKLVSVLKKCGFIDIKRVPQPDTDKQYGPVGLHMEAVKRAPFTINPKPTIACAWSVGRLMFTDTANCITQVIGRANIPIVADAKVGSAYYEKSMTLAIKGALEFNTDYILTLDYDSLFTEKDLRDMLDVMQTNPNAAACFPIQMHRCTGEVMCPKGSYEDKVEVASHGHFGLTLIRSDVFRQLPEPWFWSVPGEGGVWNGPGQRDGDIVFWDTLLFNGYEVIRANEIVIGHLDLVGIWPDGDKPIYQTVNEFKRVGKPAGTRWGTAKVAEPVK